MAALQHQRSMKNPEPTLEARLRELDWTAIAVMAAVLLGYFLFLFRASATEYKEVIAEKFPDGR